MGDELLYLSGEVLPLSEGRIHVEDRGFQLGDGVYEVVKVMNGRVLLLDEHLKRLENSLAAIRLKGASEVPGLEKAVPELVSKSQVVDGFVYIQVTRGVAHRDFEIPKSSDPTVMAYARSLPPLTAEKILAGEVLHPVQDRRWALCNIKAVDLLEDSEALVVKLWDNARYLQATMQALGFDTGASQTPILPVMLGEVGLAKQFSKRLFEQGVFAMGIGFPTVPQGLARIRVMNTAAHTREDLDFGLDTFAQVGRELGVIS